ncbi:hypothetical protein ABVC73_14080 [Prevotella melaninogenica]
MDKTRCTITSDYHSLTREAVVKLLEQRDAELEQRDAELKNKDAELEQREAELKNKDAELKNKDAELERKSRRILELERMVFGRRSEKRLPENASDWTGTLFDEQWAKEVPGSGGSPSHHQGDKTAGRTTQGITPCEPSFQKG